MHRVLHCNSFEWLPPPFSPVMNSQKVNSSPSLKTKKKIKKEFNFDDICHFCQKFFKCTSSLRNHISQSHVPKQFFRPHYEKLGPGHFVCRIPDCGTILETWNGVKTHIGKILSFCKYNEIVQLGPTLKQSFSHKVWTKYEH